jgi:hypothetical protein
MKIFLLDLWHDLREKRMWPVAALLVAGLAAVPIVLAKPAAHPAPTTPSASESQRDADLKGLAKVVLAQDEAANGSKLNLFGSDNPFRPPASVLKKGEDTTDSGSSSTGGSTDETGTGTGSDGSTEGGGSTGGGDSTPTPSPTPTPTPTPTPPKTTTQKFTYVIDLTFVHGNSTRKIKGMERLEMLPNESAPLLVFLGVDAKADNAVFMVDARLQATGEGACKPSGDKCSFLYLGAGSQEVFTDDAGESYGLQIDQIRKVEVQAKKSSKASAGKDKGARSQKRRAHSHASALEPFVAPLLTDLVTVSGDRYKASRPSSDRR